MNSSTIHFHIAPLEATSDQWPFLEESHTHLSQWSLNVITFHFQEERKWRAHEYLITVQLTCLAIGVRSEAEGNHSTFQLKQPCLI